MEKRRLAILSFMLSSCVFNFAYARVPLWTTPNGFVVGFNEPWIGDYRCDYYSAWLSRNSALNMNQGVPDGTVTPTLCNDALANRQVLLSLTTTTTGAVLPTQLVRPSDNSFLPNNYRWGIKRANSNVVKFLLFSNLQGLDIPPLTPSSPVPNPNKLTTAFKTNLNELLRQAEQMGLKVYFTVINGGEMEEWADNTTLPQMRSYYKNIISNSTTKANFKQVLNDLLSVLSTHGGTIYGIDFVNEIEAPLNVGSFYFPNGWTGARAWIAEMVSYIKNNTNYKIHPFPVTAAAGYSYAAQEITYGLFSGLGLDFYDLHEYTDSGTYSGQTALCNKVRSEQQQIILGEFGQRSTTYSDAIQNYATKAFLYGAARSCFSAALAWKFEATAYSNPQLGYRTKESGPPPPPPLQRATANFYPYRPAYCAIRWCGDPNPSNLHGAFCGGNPDETNCGVSAPW